MPERVMLYDALQYDEQVRRSEAMHKRKKDLKTPGEYLSGYGKDDRLAPVLTAVIYYGEEPWDGPESLREMTDLPEEMEGLFNDYQIHLFQVRGNRGEKFKNEDIRAVLRNADALRTGRKEDMDTKLDSGLVKYLAAFVDAEEVFRHYKVEEEEVNMCTMLNKMISEGRAEGKAEGRAEGRAEAVLYILGEMGVVSEKIQERIMEEKDLEVLQRWFKQALHSESVSQFQEMMYRM